MIINGKVINPGELRTSIELQRRTVTATPDGFDKATWTIIDVVWSRWRNAHSAESSQAAVLGVEAPATVLIRYMAGLDTTCAVLNNGVRYEIASIDDVFDLHEYMELKVKRMAAG